MMPAFVTPSVWGANLQHEQYGTDDTYRLAATWLTECHKVADWGGGGGYFKRFMRPDQWYECVDGTAYSEKTVLADLTTYRMVGHGILLRHVLDCSEEWREILANAMDCATKRIVVVTFTPDAARTGFVKMKSGWPVLHFNPDDLRAAMGRWLVTDMQVQTSHPERIYYLERPCAS